MTLYTRHQLLLVLLLVAAAGAGLAIDHWRRASPELVERLERVDRAERAATPDTGARDVRPAREPRRASHPRQRAAPAGERVAPSGGRAASVERATAGERAPRAPATPATPLDVNHASAPELARLPGIGPTLAARIVGARPFTTLDDLGRVPGLRRAVLERVRPLVALGSGMPG